MTSRPSARVLDRGAGRSRRRREQPACYRRGHKKHGHEQQAAAQEHRREKPVLALADAIPEHADEPEEGDARERDEIQRDRTAARRPESVSHVPGTRGSAGTESLSRTRAKIMNTEKTIPATAAARGVLSGTRWRPATDPRRTFLAHRWPPPSARVRSTSSEWDNELQISRRIPPLMGHWRRPSVLARRMASRDT